MNHTTNTNQDAVMEEALELLIQLNSTEEKQRVEQQISQWRRVGAEHEKAWQRVAAMWALAGELPRNYAVEVDADIDHGTDTVTREASEPVPQTGLHFPSAGWLGLQSFAQAAVIALVALGLFLAFSTDSSAPVSESYVTGSAQLRTISLDDGSILHLDAESQVSVTLSDDRRAVELRAGRVFFEVSHDASRPFIVAADNLELIVTGTAFSVGRDRANVSVSVQSGSVRATTRSAVTRQSDDVDMLAGDRLTLPRNASTLTLASYSRISPDDVGVWREGLLVADAMDFSILIEMIDRYYAGEIQMNDDVLGTTRITGVFDLTDPLTALQTLAASQNARIESLQADVLRVTAN